MSKARFGWIVVAAPIVSGCGGSDSHSGGGTAGGSGTCDLDTGYRGDCIALAAPDPADGFQLHYGPADYDDSKEVDRFVLDPGEEVVDCLHMTTPNEEEMYFDAWDIASRFGTHHIILWSDAPKKPDGTLESCPATGGPGSNWLISQQAALVDGTDGAKTSMPDVDTMAPENRDLAWRIGPRTNIAYQAHFVNATTEPLLRESWTNLYARPKNEVGGVVDVIAFIGGLGLQIPPRSKFTTDLQVCAVPPGFDDIRIVSLTGHMHAHGVRFSVWKRDKNGDKTLVYENFDWSEPEFLSYDSVTKNPKSDPSTKRGGGHSGLLTLSAGEEIHYECEYDNDSDDTLVWANEAYTAEMCNLIGFYTPGFGGPWGCQNF